MNKSVFSTTRRKAVQKFSTALGNITSMDGGKDVTEKKDKGHMSDSAFLADRGCLSSGQASGHHRPQMQH